MATDVGPEIAETAVSSREAPGPMLYRLSVDQYRKMIDAGVFPAGARVELLGGILIRKMTKNPPHDFGVDLLAELARRLLPPDWIVRQEKSLDLDHRSRPEPDIVIAAGPRILYRDRDPTAKDVALIVEVSDSTYRQDRGVKWRRYAAAKVPVYGILNISRRRMEIYREPAGSGKDAAYREATIHDETTDFPVILNGQEIGRIAVKDILS